MNVREQQKTYDGFIKMSVRGTVAVIIMLLIIGALTL